MAIFCMLFAEETSLYSPLKRQIKTFMLANARNDHRMALKRGRFYYVTCPHRLSELTAPLRKQRRALTKFSRLRF